MKRQHIGLTMLAAAFVVPAIVGYGLEFGLARLGMVVAGMVYLCVAIWLAVQR